ncbi:WXG100 family type VII secretion target [Nocardioides acrostichi]|uniref:ESAT-6-like protein n=1 Tax=Nocardioides acrostichi TaxID=2784339 RepID=A0A930V352_9ACTN|nr:WXG100 family type VII secretion target [Nocardioides acrostichi]MBF4161766.1 WXG100 family type VII secretion target [Nocardioides acrostichi]MBF4162334.1 WXG100 family type VII secretion target [Nocardioides acrostichi]
MSNGTISVSHGDIEAQAKNLANIKNQLEGILQAAKSQVDSLRDSGGFKSSAGDSFNVTYQDWTQANLKSVGLLEEMSHYLTKASGAFAEIDNAYTIK